MKRLSLALALTAIVWMPTTLVGEQPKPIARNPFGVVDVLAPDWKDVELFAGTVKLSGDNKDANAASWGEKVDREPASIEGD
jgi:hypothetical protein